jgi:formyltetrahydrofolate synthetase
VLDMNDRALRNAIVGLGGPGQGVPRETGFDITAASEVMALLCLARNEGDLRARIEWLLVAFTEDGAPVTAKDLAASGAMLALHCGEGALELARVVHGQATGARSPFQPLYRLEDPFPDKVLAVASRMYGARGVVLTKEAQRDLREVRRLGYEQLPVCIAKTPASLSDDPKLRGRPRDFDVTVRSIQINAGAGFLVALTGEILRMPGLPRRPLAESMDVRDGEIVGVH